MTKIKLLSVFGTRPEAAKMCPLVRELATRPQFESKVCVTAQHRQMLDQVMDAFGVTADFDLDIMRPSQTLTDITVRALPGLSAVIEEYQPHMVLVHGDTTTAFVAALAAFYAKIPVAHVEAGLRSFDPLSPYPEEMNRLLIDRLAAVLLAPTATNARNLRAEGLHNNIYITGNTVIDGIAHTVRDDYIFEEPTLRDINFANRKVITLTAHRRENYGEAMEAICAAAADIAGDPEALIVYPVHLSPYVQETARKHLENLGNVRLIPPVSVADMHNLMARSRFIMTDSGGLQEEGPALGKPVMVLRRETERPEAVEAGTVHMTGVDRDAIAAFARELLTEGETYRRMARAVNPYGDGQASRRIADDLLFHFGLAENPAEDFGV